MFNCCVPKGNLLVIFSQEENNPAGNSAFNVFME